MLETEARPGELAAERAEAANGAGRSVVIVPTALAVRKRGRWCTVAKLVWFDAELALVTCWRSQVGTSNAISLPSSVLVFAQQAGARRYVLRDDRHHRAWCCPLTLFKSGRLGRDGEWYIPITWLTPTPWPDWAFTKRVLRLSNSQDHHSEQLQLFASVGVDA